MTAYIFFTSNAFYFTASMIFFFFLSITNIQKAEKKKLQRSLCIKMEQTDDNILRLIQQKTAVCHVFPLGTVVEHFLPDLTKSRKNRGGMAHGQKRKRLLSSVYIKRRRGR